MITEKFRDRIREDSVATINTQGLLGDKYIFISVGSPEEPIIPDDGAIQTREVVGLFDLAEKGGDIIEDLQGAAKSISKVLGGLSSGKENVNDILKSVKDLFEEIEHGKGLLHALIYDPDGQEVISALADNLKALRTLLGQTDGSDKHKKMQNVMKNINKVAMNLGEITEKINRGEGSLGGVINDPTIYNEIRGIFGKVNRNNLFKTVIRATLEENESQVLK